MNCLSATSSRPDSLDRAIRALKDNANNPAKKKEAELILRMLLLAGVQNQFPKSTYSASLIAGAAKQLKQENASLHYRKPLVASELARHAAAFSRDLADIVHGYSFSYLEYAQDALATPRDQ